MRRVRGVAAATAFVLAGAAGALLAACGGGDEPEPQLSAQGEVGRQIAATRGCAGCHRVDGRDAAGPTWKGLYGSERNLTDGRTVVADEAYLRQAIVDPWAQRVEGYATIMPRFSLTEEEVAALVTYIRELS